MQSTEPLPSVRGLAFLGFPLHRAGRPSQERGQHLFDVHIPMLFLQGTRDALAETKELLDGWRDRLALEVKTCRNDAPAKLCVRSMPDSSAAPLSSLPAQAFETAHRSLGPATKK
jgi:hypothetical protein